MDFLTVKEAAELKGCSVQYMQKQVKNGAITAEQRKHPQNGKMCYMIPVTALSEDLKEKYYKQKRTETGVLPEKIEEEAPEKTAPKYRSNGKQRAFDSFSATERTQIQNWIELLTEWQTERAKRKDKTEFDKLFVAHQKYINPEINISVDILYRKYNAYKNECYDGLLDHRGGWNRGKSKLPDDSIIWQCFLQLYLQNSQPRVSQCYRSTVAYIAEEHPELVSEIPTERSFRRKIETIPFAVLEYARGGNKAMHDHCIPHAQRMHDRIHANSIWVMDNYTFDVMVKEDDNPAVRKRMYLTTVLDVKSGVLVGYNITDTPDSQSTLIALRYAILRFGVPDMLYFDNGREFTTNDIVGEEKNRKLAKDKKGNLPPTILKRLGIEIIIALPTNAQAKVVERAHRTIKEQYCRSANGFCGGNVIERPESLKRRIKNGDIETEKELREGFAQYADYVFNVAPYGGVEPKYKGMTAIEVWNTSMSSRTMRVATEDVLDLLLMRTNGYQKIKREGVFIPYHGEKLWYYDEHNTWQHIGEEVYVRYNPNDLTSVRIYDREDRYLYTWKCADWAIMEYANEAQDSLAELGRKKTHIQRQIVERARELRGKPFITQRMGLQYCAKHDRDKFEIRLPKSIAPIMANESPLEEKQAVGAETNVVFDLKRIRRNAMKRKEE